MNQAKQEFDRRCEGLLRAKKDNLKLNNLSTPSFRQWIPSARKVMSCFSKAHKLRAATVFPNMLAFARRYRLKLIEDETKDGKGFYDSGTQRSKYEESAGKESDWLKYPLITRRSLVVCL